MRYATLADVEAGFRKLEASPFFVLTYSSANVLAASVQILGVCVRDGLHPELDDERWKQR